MEHEYENTRQSVWKPELYRMQLEAPTPKPIICNFISRDRPLYLGTEYHGAITFRQADELLENEPEGSFLVRSSASADGKFHTLSLKFNKKVHHYKLYYDSLGLYVREKRYNSLRTLVADGLVTMYLELKAPHVLQRMNSSVIYQESPYMTLNKRKLKVLSRTSSNAKPATSVITGTKKPVPIAPVVAPQVAPSVKKPNSFPFPLVTTQSTIFTTGFSYNSPGDAQTPTEYKFEKPHTFRIRTFKGLNWCEFCGNFLWGFTAQGVKCEDCGFVAHVKCSHSVPSDCVPDLKKVRGVFGIDLTNVLAAKKATLPFVVIRCVSEIEVRGLMTEGIYRLSGFADEIDALKLAFDTDGEKADLSETAISNINVIAGALKLYLRLLPVPLITFSAHPHLIQAIQRKSLPEQIKGIREGLALLPIAHYHTLQFMLEHLQRVSQHQAINKMTAHNLATVFAPTLIGPPNTPGLGPPDITSDIYLIEIMILHCDKIFQ